jgi:hypothetical protein
MGVAMHLTPEEAARVHPIHERVTNEIWEVIKRHQDKEAGVGEDQVSYHKFQYTCMLSLIRAAAQFAVDLSIEEQQYLMTSQVIYKDANKNAARFG